MTKTIKLTEGDRIFVHHVLLMYASKTSGLTSIDIKQIKEIAAKFK